MLIKNRLKSAEIEDFEFESFCIFEHVTKINRTKFMLRRDDDCDENNVNFAIKIAEKRASLRYPLQYLLGSWEFYGYEFSVGEGVLIPRADTETVIEVITQSYKNREEKLRIIDLCAGSGAISITLAKLYPNAEVFAVEKSGEAFSYLADNVRANEVSVKLIRGDVFDAKVMDNFLSDRENLEYNKVDIIVSNPPYLTAKEMGELQTEVSFEPALALDGGFDGLSFYRGISSLWKEILKNGGKLCYEIGNTQAVEVENIMKNAGFSEIEMTKDLGGNDRVLIGSLC